MGIIDYIDNNKHLKTLFPHGVEEVLVGQFGLDQGRFSLNLHVYTKPAQETPKWGIWGRDYDVIVIQLLGVGLGEINIRNWDNFKSGVLTCEKRDGTLFLSYDVDECAFKISCRGLALQKCSTYIA